MSLRTWFLVLSVALILAALGGATALVLSTSRLASDASEMREAVQSVQAADRVATALLRHHRLQALADGNASDLDLLRREEREILTGLEEARRHADPGQELVTYQVLDEKV